MDALPYLAPLADNFIEWLHASKYFLFFLGTIFEGPTMMLAGGVVLRFGGVEALPLFMALFLGDFLSDLFWYVIGYFGARTAVNKWGKIIGVTPKTVQKIEERFHRYHEAILIISKLTMGFGFAIGTLLVAGMLRVKFWKFALINFLCGMIWTAILIVAGYLFGNVIEFVPLEYKILLVAMAAFAVYIVIKVVTGKLQKLDT